MARRSRVWLLGVLCGLVCALAGAREARALTVQELATLDGTAPDRLWGLGLVIGLQGTGDSSQTLPMLRQLARLLENGTNVVPSVEELVKTRNVAMVMVTCSLPRDGARRGEVYNLHVQALHDAKSIVGGELFITPLQGPLPGSGVYAFGAGRVEPDGSLNTVGLVRQGATMSYDIRKRVVDGSGMIRLHVRPSFAGWTTTRMIATAINQDRQGFDETAPEVARAVDGKTIEVQIPGPERRDPAGFISSVLSIRLDPSLLNLPARVIVNRRTGSIVVDGRVGISPVVISHANLVVTTVNPPQAPTPEFPEVRRTSATAVGNPATERSTARLEDLLDAMRALDVPIEDQIAILAQMHAIGNLHAELIVE